MFATARKHLKTAAMVAVRSLDDRGWAIAVDFGMRLLRVVFLLSLWRMLLPETGEVSGMTRAAVLTYTLVAEAFSGLLASRSGLDAALWRGDIANRFLRPAGIYGQFMAEMFGGSLNGLLLFALPLYCIAPAAGGSTRCRRAPPPRRCSWAAWSWPSASAPRSTSSSPA